MKTSIVLTTIHVPYVLEQYIKNCTVHGHKDIFFVIIGDRKSPTETYSYIESLQEYSYEIVYLGIPEQEHWLKKFPEFGRYIPYDSVQRRNIGYLYAAEMETDVIISIDDDNIPLSQYDYVGEHNIVSQTIEYRAVSSSTGWFNTCSLLNTKPERYFYHRGFPFNKRWITEELSYRVEKKRVVVNVGLWTGDPDVDTITRMEEPFRVVGLKEQLSRLGLAQGTMSPFNSQNTAFSVELLPCLYLITFEAEAGLEILCGNNNFRYDDIWMSYFAKIIIDHMGDAVCIGLPYVEQQRNTHDYLLDLRKELGPMEITNKLVDILPNINITENTYFGAYRELIDQLCSKVVSNLCFTRDERYLLQRMTDGVELWLDAVAKIHSTEY